MMARIGFCSEDRKSEGIFADLTVRENIILALQAKNGIFKYITTRKQLEIADEMIKSLAIVTPSANNRTGQLSGGNQQKVMLARWLATNPIVLILDEPTRGIDVGAKLEIMELILSLSRKGMGVMFISSEFEEVVRCSSRIAVLKDKVKIAELNGEDMNETRIMRTIGEETDVISWKFLAAAISYGPLSPLQSSCFSTCSSRRISFAWRSRKGTCTAT